MKIKQTVALFSLMVLGSAVAMAQEEKMHEVYHAFGVAMTQGVSGVLDINITRWTTEDERKALVDALVGNGQEKMVELLRKQDETGFARTQTGAGMQGWPSTRLHYAYQFPQADGKRLVIIVTDRNISMAEQMRNSRSTDYEVSAIVMELQKGEDGKEEGQGTLYLATKLGYDKDKQKIEVESLGQQPIRLTSIKRQK